MNRKKLCIVGMVVLCVFLCVVLKKNGDQGLRTNQSKKSVQIPTPPTHSVSSQKTSIFIPYWALGQDREQKEYDEFYYFGVAPRADGTVEEDQGKNNIELLDSSQMKKTTLVVRMMDKDISDVLMNEAASQKKLASGLIHILNNTKMKGVALDMEIPFSLDADKPNQITNFVQQICTPIKADYKTCGLIVYGDAFYHKRPYDMKALGKIVDSVLVMAYDFHKSMGEPGPNFSFDGREKYGYDFKHMIEDFSTSVSKDKLIVIFGMYGYDWTLNEQGMPLKSAEALTLKQIKNKALHTGLSYVQSSEGDAQEKSATYKDEEGKKHIIWYEDEESVAVKTEYLKSQGIPQISFWASGYF